MAIRSEQPMVSGEAGQADNSQAGTAKIRRSEEEDKGSDANHMSSVKFLKHTR